MGVLNLTKNSCFSHSIQMPTNLIFNRVPCHNITVMRSIWTICIKFIQMLLPKFYELIQIKWRGSSARANNYSQKQHKSITIVTPFVIWRVISRLPTNSYP